MARTDKRVIPGGGHRWFRQENPPGGTPNMRGWSLLAVLVLIGRECVEQAQAIALPHHQAPWFPQVSHTPPLQLPTNAVTLHGNTMFVFDLDLVEDPQPRPLSRDRPWDASSGFLPGRNTNPVPGTGVVRLSLRTWNASVGEHTQAVFLRLNSPLARAAQLGARSGESWVMSNQTTASVCTDGWCEVLEPTSWMLQTPSNQLRQAPKSPPPAEPAASIGAVWPVQWKQIQSHGSSQSAFVFASWPTAAIGEVQVSRLSRPNKHRLHPPPSCPWGWFGAQCARSRCTRAPRGDETCQLKYAHPVFSANHPPVWHEEWIAQPAQQLTPQQQKQVRALDEQPGWWPRALTAQWQWRIRSARAGDLASTHFALPPAPWQAGQRWLLASNTSNASNASNATAIWQQALAQAQGAAERGPGERNAPWEIMVQRAWHTPATTQRKAWSWCENGGQWRGDTQTCDCQFPWSGARCGQTFCDASRGVVAMPLIPPQNSPRSAAVNSTNRVNHTDIELATGRCICRRNYWGPFCNGPWLPVLNQSGANASAPKLFVTMWRGHWPFALDHPLVPWVGVWPQDWPLPTPELDGWYAWHIPAALPANATNHSTEAKADPWADLWPSPWPGPESEDNFTLDRSSFQPRSMAGVQEWIAVTVIVALLCGSAIIFTAGIHRQQNSPSYDSVDEEYDTIFTREPLAQPVFEIGYDSADELEVAGDSPTIIDPIYATPPQSPGDFSQESQLDDGEVEAQAEEAARQV